MERHELPVWMRSRDSRTTIGDEHQRKVLTIVFSVMSGALIVLGAYAAIERSTWFALTVIAAGASLIVLAVLANVKCSVKTVVVFIFSAVVVTDALHRPQDIPSEAVAVVFAILYTGMFGLLLLSRTETKLSRGDKVTVMMVPLTLCVAGLLAEEYIIAILMIPLVLITFLVLSARHNSEVTLPSDKWT